MVTTFKSNTRGFSEYELALSELALPTPSLKRFIWAVSEWLGDYLLQAWTAHLLTFKFTPLTGSRSVVMHKMRDELQRVYSTLLTRVVRHPRSKSHKGSRPILVAVPDLPVAKRKKQTCHDGLIDDGLHFHGILLMPPCSRLKKSVIDHFATNETLYVKKALLELDVRRIDSDLPKVVDYLFKSIKRRSFGWDDWYVLG